MWNSFPEFDNHSFVSYINDPKNDLRGFVAIHRLTHAKPAFGATRVWNYSSDVEAVRDVLALSRMMTYKAALARVPYSGAKAVLFKPKNPKKKKAFLKSLARIVTMLSGSFYTGADVGLSPGDIRYMSRICPYMIGTQCDPVRYTVEGLITSLNVCITDVFHNGELSKRSFVIQGLGKTGVGFLKKIYKDAKEIYVTDIDKMLCKNIKTLYPSVRIIDPNDIVSLPVDVYVPCALSKCLTRRDSRKYKCKIILGSANNQLEDTNVGTLLHSRGILYAPDYVVNAGGLISVVDEYAYHNSIEDRIQKKMTIIPKTLRTILQLSNKKDVGTNIIADTMAQEIIRKNLPI